jgi:hypothetical protein
VAMQVEKQRGGTTTAVYQCLEELERLLEKSRLEAEYTFGPRLNSTRQQEWVRQNRSKEAEQWHVLTTWRPEHLQSASR